MKQATSKIYAKDTRAFFLIDECSDICNPGHDENLQTLKKGEGSGRAASCGIVRPALSLHRQAANCRGYVINSGLSPSVSRTVVRLRSLLHL